MASDPETIVDAVAAGLPIREVARRYELSESDVRAILEEATRRCYDGAAMREEWMLEARRLAAVGLKFYRKAMSESDPQAAIVFIKASERRATLAGANQPLGHSVRIMEMTAVQAAPTSTERLRRVMDTLCAIQAPPRDDEPSGLD